LGETDKRLDPWTVYMTNFANFTMNDEQNHDYAVSKKTSIHTSWNPFVEHIVARFLRPEHNNISHVKPPLIFKQRKTHPTSEQKSVIR